MSWILIAVFYTYSASGGTAATSQQIDGFRTEADCGVAAERIRETFKEPVRVVCVARPLK